MRITEDSGKKKYNESLANDNSFMPILLVRAVVEVLFVNNDILHDEIDVLSIIHSNKLVRNGHNYEFTEIHFS
jgi:hypothetical protein